MGQPLMNAHGRYQRADLNSQAEYETPLLPGLRLHVPTLWQEPLPDVIAIVDQVRAMLAAGEAKCRPSVRSVG